MSGQEQSRFESRERAAFLVEQVVDGKSSGYRQIAKDNDVSLGLAWQYTQEAKDLAKDKLRDVYLNAVDRKVRNIELDVFSFYDIGPHVNFDREEAMKICNGDAPDHVVAEMMYEMTHPLRLKPPSELTEAQREGVRRLNVNKYGVTYDFKNTTADEDILVRLIKPRDSVNGNKLAKTTAEDDCADILALLEEGGVEVTEEARDELTKALPPGEGV